MMRDQLKSLKTACGIMKNQIHDFFFKSATVSGIGQEIRLVFKSVE